MTYIEGINAQTLLILTYVKNHPYSTGAEISKGTDIACNYAHAILKNLLAKRLLECRELTYGECLRHGTSHLSSVHYELTDDGRCSLIGAAAWIPICGKRILMTAPQIMEVRQMVKSIEWENRNKELKVIS